MYSNGGIENEYMTSEEFNTLRVGDWVLQKEPQRVVKVVTISKSESLIVGVAPKHYIRLCREDVSLITEEFKETHPELFI